MKKVLVTGAGGFIGGHLVKRLKTMPGIAVRAVDVKPGNEWYQRFDDVENITADLRLLTACEQASEGVEEIYNLAADMGGMGFIETHKTDCMLSVLINTHLLMAAKKYGTKRYFFSSTACVYNAAKQTEADAPPLKESDAYPAMPEDGYGWEKLFSERMCHHYAEEHGLTVRVARFHNSYGPHGTWQGGREKAPAALCRKVLEAIDNGKHEIEVWGDGNQTRSFMYIHDNIDGILKIMQSDIAEPINLGSSERVTINQLIDLIENIAGVKLKRRYLTDKPQGVYGRSSDNTLIKETLGWQPETPLVKGIDETYRWIAGEMKLAA